MTEAPPAERIGVLFDIDGTLLDMRGAGRRSFAQAVEAVFGWPDDIGYVNFAGNTDLNVLQQVMAAHRHTMTETEQRAFLARLPEELERAAAGAELVLFPGVRELLETLSGDPRVLLGLVTGNVERCARIKLRQFDLHNHFILGAYGDEHADRGRIAELALARVRRALPPGAALRACFLVGDTPFDIAAAGRVGATSIGVATGKFNAGELRAAGADHVFTDLSDTDAVLRWLGLRG